MQRCKPFLLCSFIHFSKLKAANNHESVNSRVGLIATCSELLASEAKPLSFTFTEEASTNCIAIDIDPSKKIAHRGWPYPIDCSIVKLNDTVQERVKNWTGKVSVRLSFHFVFYLPNRNLFIRES